jgi:hypothetical protein
VTGVTYLFAGGTAIGTFWNAVVSLGENRDSGYLWTGIWYHHLFPEVGYQLQFWCNLIQGPHLQQFCLELLVAAIHTGSGAPVWSIQEECLQQQQLNQVKPNQPMA